MKLGDIVKNKESGNYGTVEYSSFGYSIHLISEDGILQKTLGDKANVLSKYWEVVEMPEGYEIGKYGELEKCKR